MQALSLRRSLVVCSVFACAVAIGGCGASHRATHGETEGVYVDAGPLTYQVQLSRQLNPRDVEDAAYLKGLRPAQVTLSPKDTWFGIWMRIANETKQPHGTAATFTITDTKDNVFRPVRLAYNVFAYHPRVLGAGHIYPTPNSVAGEGATSGSMVLFRLPVASFENRPLELRIVSPTGQQASVTLDV